MFYDYGNIKNDGNFSPFLKNVKFENSLEMIGFYYKQLYFKYKNFYKNDKKRYKPFVYRAQSFGLFLHRLIKMDISPFITFYETFYLSLFFF